MRVSTNRPLLIYDGNCGICTASVNWLLGKGAAQFLDMEPFQSEPLEMKRAGLSLADCQRAVWVLQPTRSGWVVYSGAAAVNFTLARLQGRNNFGWRLLGRMYVLPLLRQLEDLVYSLVARNRHLFSFGRHVCLVPSEES